MFRRTDRGEHMSTVTTTAADDPPADGSPSDDGRRTLVRWLRPEGAVVGVDEPLCEVAGDGHTVEAIAPEPGVLRHGVRAGGHFLIGDEVFRLDPLP